MLGRAIGALLARVLGAAVVGNWGGGGVAAFCAYVGRAKARGLLEVDRPVIGVGGCWAGQSWVGLEPLI